MLAIQDLDCDRHISKWSLGDTCRYYPTYSASELCFPGFVLYGSVAITNCKNDYKAIFQVQLYVLLYSNTQWLRFFTLCRLLGLSAEMNRQKRLLLLHCHFSISLSSWEHQILLKDQIPYPKRSECFSVVFLLVLWASVELNTFAANVYFLRVIKSDVICFCLHMKCQLNEYLCYDDDDFLVEQQILQ